VFPNLEYLTLVHTEAEDCVMVGLSVLERLHTLILKNVSNITGSFLGQADFTQLHTITFKDCVHVSVDVNAAGRSKILIE
jgi:hypothetical protein